MDVNKPITNPNVIAAMDAFLKNQNPRTELDMLQMTTRAKFMAPVVFDKPVIDGKVQPDTKISQCTITNTKQEKFFFAFTDEEAMNKWAKEQKFDFLLLSLAEFLALLTRSKDQGIHGVVLNPMSQNITFTREMLVNLPKRHQELLKIVPPRFLLGRPKEEPLDLEDGLKKYFKKKQKTIKEAWMLMALREGNNTPRLMLVVDYDGEPEDAKEIFPAIVEEAKSYLGKDEGIDIVRRDGKFAEDVLAKTDSFYQKKAGFFW